MMVLHYLKDPKLWELGYIPYYGSCRMYIINIWAVVKIMAPFGVPNIVRHLIFRVAKKDPKF